MSKNVKTSAGDFIELIRRIPHRHRSQVRQIIERVQSDLGLRDLGDVCVDRRQLRRQDGDPGRIAFKKSIEKRRENKVYTVTYRSSGRIDTMNLTSVSKFVGRSPQTVNRIIAACHPLPWCVVVVSVDKQEDVIEITRA